jgi:hypothetical protein
MGLKNGPCPADSGPLLADEPQRALDQLVIAVV